MSEVRKFSFSFSLSFWPPPGNPGQASLHVSFLSLFLSCFLAFKLVLSCFSLPRRASSRVGGLSATVVGAFGLQHLFL